MNSGGIRFARQSPLVRRAVEAIERSPISTERLAREVFSLRQAPPGLASRLVFDLLGQDGRVRVDEGGVWHLVVAAPDSGDIPLSAVRWVVVDVETTGSSVAGGGRIVEFAAVHVTDGAIEAEFETLVNPEVWIPGWVTRLTGIERGMVEVAPRFREIATTVRVCLENRVFVAHNVSFDWRFVAEEMRLARALMPEGPRLCTVKLARRALPGLRRRGLDSLARYYDLEIENRHRAGDDARATALILTRMLDAADRQGIRYWNQLSDWMAGRPVIHHPTRLPARDMHA